MMQVLHYCKRERCVWRIHTGGKPVCTRARCPYRERVSYILREHPKDDGQTDTPTQSLCEQTGGQA